VGISHRGDDGVVAVPGEFRRTKNKHPFRQEWLLPAETGTQHRRPA
jgi:hypothetical protein